MWERGMSEALFCVTGTGGNMPGGMLGAGVGGLPSG